MVGAALADICAVRVSREKESDDLGLGSVDECPASFIRNLLPRNADQGQEGHNRRGVQWLGDGL
jgi:hypothetical protein